MGAPTSMIVLTDSAFGHDVAARLGVAAHAQPLIDFLRAPNRDALGTEGFLAVALQHKRMRQLEALDDWCRAQGIRWGLCFLVDRYLYCGPSFVPNHSPCLRCFYRRDLTHLTHPREAVRERAMDSAFESQPGLHLPGHTAGSVGMAAAFLAQCRDGRMAAGRLRRVHLLEGGMDDTEVFGIHDCPHCSGKTRAQMHDQSYVHLAAALQELLG